MDRKEESKATGATELKQMLECIFDHEEFEGVRSRVEQRELAMAQSFLAASGIDTESFLDKAVVTVRSSVTAVDSESEGAPFSQEAFDALDEDELITYLEGQGIDAPQVVGNMMLRIHEHARFTTANDEQRLQDDQPVVHTVERNSIGKRWGAFLASIVSAAGGVGQQLRPAVFALVAVGAVVVGMWMGEYGFSPLPEDVNTGVHSLLADNEPILRLYRDATRVPLTRFRLSDQLGLGDPLGLDDPLGLGDPLDLGAGETNHPDASGAGQTYISSVTADSQITVPSMLTETRGMNKVGSTQKVAADSAMVDTVDREMVFVKGDTLWDGMAKHGVSGALQAELTKKINVVFHPGDRVVFNFVDGEFNGLEILLGNQDKITITKDLSLVATHISRTDIQTVVGTVKHSLHGALARKLNDQAAWRVATRMKHLGVPVNTLQSGAQFEVRIERRTVPGGEVVGYGEIKYVRLDAGKQGKFVFDSKSVASETSV